jgi:hypothetical protein
MKALVPSAVIGALVVPLAATLTLPAAASPSAGHRACSWRVVPSPNAGPRQGDDFLFGVAVVSARQAWAVGTEPTSFSQTLAIRWNGARWLSTKTANPGQGGRFFQAVAAPSAKYALAVGSDLSGSQTKALAERWTGSTWSLVPAASPGADYNSLQAIAARNSGYAWAVGSRRAKPFASFRTLAERWNGRAWTQAAAPSPGRGFWAVGQAGQNTLVERYC